MKRKLVILGLMMFLTITALATPSRPTATQPTNYCNLAEDTCRGMQRDAIDNCRANNGDDCFCAGVHAFNACMTQFGCSGYTEQQMIERGCGPQ